MRKIIFSVMRFASFLCNLCKIQVEIAFSIVDSPSVTEKEKKSIFCLTYRKIHGQALIRRPTLLTKIRRVAHISGIVLSICLFDYNRISNSLLTNPTIA